MRKGTLPEANARTLAEQHRRLCVSLHTWPHFAIKMNQVVLSPLGAGRRGIVRVIFALHQGEKLQPETAGISEEKWSIIVLSESGR